MFFLELIPGFPAFPGNGVRSRKSDTPFHAQESYDDMSSQQNPSNCAQVFDKIELWAITFKIPTRRSMISYDCTWFSYDFIWLSHDFYMVFIWFYVVFMTAQIEEIQKNQPLLARGKKGRTQKLGEREYNSSLPLSRITYFLYGSHMILYGSHMLLFGFHMIL